ncbi:MAG: hypothetical protein QHJ81_14795 [Anaerolineae bacterium]|nr:hypothetical protein [Anaerolineae bacterium]
MKAQVYLPEEVMVRRALEALLRALGPVEVNRFLTLPRQRRLDAVQRHRQWQATLDKDQFFDQVFGETALQTAEE